MASVEQYQNWVLQRIGQLIMKQQLHCQASAQRGPFTLNCTLRLTADPVGGLRKLLALGPSLRMVLQTNVRIIQADQWVIIEAELPSQAHITPNAAKLVKATRWPQIAIGLMILINHIPPQAMTVMVAGTLLIVGLICFLMFILVLIALLLPNPSYGATLKPEEPKTINQTLIVFTIPGRDPYVLPDKNQSTGKPTAFLPGALWYRESGKEET